MAINTKEFVNVVDVGLKADTNYMRFFYRFKFDGKTKRGILDFSNKDWDKRTRISQAKKAIESLKLEDIDTGVNFTEKTSLNKLAEIYFEIACDNTEWNRSRYSSYKLYCENGLGKKPIKNIRQVDIDKLRKDMEKKGHSKQTENGCSPRTIKRVLVQVIKPILQYAVDNKVLADIPRIVAPKQNRQKKIVNSAGEKLANLYKAIMTHYQDNAFYRALFLFALYGRRWNEIRTLEWSDIDVLDNKYTIRSKNNKIGQDQTYELSIPIAHALSEIKDDKIGLIFKSPITSKELHPPRKQLEKIKELADVPELTMHYFRHILVSAMGELGTATTVLSASLGHTNLDTVNNFYLSANHTKASHEANIAIGKLTVDK